MDIKEKIQLKLDDDFFQEEVRCGYKVSVKAKRMMAINLDLLYQMDKVCKSLGVEYFIYAGSLLGAVRHKGFIPWDDDIDVAMTRQNFEKFIKEAPSLFKDPYFLQTALTDRKYFIGYARLRNSLTTGLILTNESLEYNNGIYIDIFVLDGFVDDDLKFKKYIKKRNRLNYLINAYQMNDLDPCNKAKNILKSILHKTFCKIVPMGFVYKWYHRHLAKYTPYTNRLSLMTHSDKILKNYWCTKEEINDIVYLPFESIVIPAPSKYKEILSHMYGDYMKFPPVEKRGVWHTGIIEQDPDIPYKEYILKRKMKE